MYYAHPRRRFFAALLPALFTLGLLAGCSSADGTGSGEGAAAGERDPDLPFVAVASYPLAYIVQEVGGDKVVVEDLSTTSGHAHNLELSPAQVGRLGSVDLVLYLSQGFQPAVEEAIRQTGAKGLDALSAVPEEELIPGDSHVWLDPNLVADIGEEVAVVLAEANPGESQYYKDNADDLSGRLADVDAQYQDVLSGCTGEVLLTTHEAFGYMAKRYGLEQVGVTGIDPEAEPSPARIRELQKVVADEGITTLFVEPLASDHHEKHLVEALGVEGLPLDTIEVQVDPDLDVIGVYKLNLESLGQGLTCARG